MPLRPPATRATGPSSPIGKRSSRFPALDIALPGRDHGAHSPLGLSPLRHISPIASRAQPPKRVSSLASVRHAAKASSDAATRLPSPFRMAPSLAAKREQIRQRWPAGDRPPEAPPAPVRRLAPGLGATAANCGCPNPAAQIGRNAEGQRHLRMDSTRDPCSHVDLATAAGTGTAVGITRAVGSLSALPPAVPPASMRHSPRLAASAVLGGSSEAQAPTASRIPRPTPFKGVASRPSSRGSNPDTRPLPPPPYHPAAKAPSKRRALDPNDRPLPRPPSSSSSDSPSLRASRCASSPRLSRNGSASSVAAAQAKPGYGSRLGSTRVGSPAGNAGAGSTKMVITPPRASPVASAPAGGERDVSTLEVLRVDMTRGDFFAQVRASIRSGAVLLDEVQRCARALKEADGGRPAATESAAACRVWQCLRGGAASSQAAGDHRLATPIDLSGVTDGPERVARLRRDAQDLCGLLRLSLCDSADLQLARSVLSDAEAFLATIEARAATTGLTPSDVWRQLQSESLPPASPAGGAAASSSARKV